MSYGLHHGCSKRAETKPHAIPRIRPMVWAMLAILPTKPNQQTTNHTNIITTMALCRRMPKRGLNFPCIQK